MSKMKLRATAADKWVGLTGKVLVAMGLMSTVVVVAMFLGNRWAFERGFLDYLAATELQHLDPVVVTLGQAYRDHGNTWDFLHTNPLAWPRICALASEHRERDTPSALPGETFRRGQGEFGGFGLRAAQIDQAGQGLAERLRVLDTDGEEIIGTEIRSTHESQIPVETDGRVVGYLGVAPPVWLESELDQRFEDQQARASMAIAVVALLLALSIGFYLGRRITAPLQSLTGGARQLAQGHYETRVSIRGGDELGQLAQDFNRLAATLEQSETWRRQSMADASHELRTPLAVLSVELEALVDGIRTCDQTRLVQLHERVKGLSRLVDDLFYLALADAGALGYRKETLDLSDLLVGAVGRAEAAFAMAELSIDMDIAPNLPVFADEQRLQQVFVNLFKNSQRYTDSGGRVSVQVYRRGDRVVVDVQDSAPGVEAMHLDRLFDRFYRTETSRNRRHGGTGLGLSICRKIVEAHEGSIEARASSLGGLWIKIELPLETTDTPSAIQTPVTD